MTFGHVSHFIVLFNTAKAEEHRRILVRKPKVTKMVLLPAESNINQLNPFPQRMSSLSRSLGEMALVC